MTLNTKKLFFRFSMECLLPILINNVPLLDSQFLMQDNNFYYNANLEKKRTNQSIRIRKIFYQNQKEVRLFDIHYSSNE
jgi:hypothetical protein